MVEGAWPDAVRASKRSPPAPEFSARWNRSLFAVLAILPKQEAAEEAAGGQRQAEELELAD